ncbi:MAG: zinc-binding dehydrogenase [Candidatus Promineifilaceae bacterium]|jgi:NADPH:quinone reductase-like Zn-dependent oxidoreductase
MRQLFQAMWHRRGNDKARQKSYVVDLEQSQEDLLLLKELLEAGKVRPVIDAVYPLQETADAFRTYENKHARGKIVIGINQNGSAK